MPDLNDAKTQTTTTAAASTPTAGTEAGKDGATAPAALTPDKLNEAIAAALKPITEQLAVLTKGSAGEGAGKGGKKDADAPVALTPEAVAKIVADQLAAHQTTQAAQSARTAYANDKLKDLPQTYRDLLPQTGDPVKLAEAEQQIRARYRAEIGDKAAAGTSVGGGGGGAAPDPKVDLSKLSPTKKIEHALSARK